MNDTVTFAYALDRLDGVGRVTATRLLSHFATYDDLLRYPREQVMTRIKGAPNAAALVGRLFDEETMRGLLAHAGLALEALQQKGVRILTLRDPLWPSGLDALPRGRRPFLLYVYGHAHVFHQPRVALLGRPPLPEAAFEQAQALVRQLLQQAIAPVSAALTGFDVVVHKIASAGPQRHPAALVASCGMAQLHASLRPVVSQAVRAGGTFLSPFSMEHGPFPHDDADRALVQVALSDAAVFVAPRPETAEWQALVWALEAGRPVFGLQAEASLPERVHLLKTPVDFDWVAAAANRRDDPPEP